MSSDNPYGTGQPGPWGQGGPASGPSGPPPYGYPPPPAGPPQPPGAPGSGYAFGPFAPQPGPGPGPTSSGPGATPPPRGGARGLIILGVVALALILVGVGAAVLVRSRGAVAPSPTPAPASTSGGGSAPRPAPADDPTATTVTASYTLGKTPVTVDYGVTQVGGEWKLTAVHKTLDLGLVRSPSIPLLINGVKVTSDFVDVLPGTYTFSTESPLLTLGSKAVIEVKHPNDYANVLDLRVGLSSAGRKTVVNVTRKSYRTCLKSKVTRPRNCPFAWTSPGQRYRQNSVRWRQLGADPFTKPNVAVIERSVRVGIPLRVRISGPCTFSGVSGTCSGNVTGRGVASIRLDKAPLKVVWLT